MHLRTTTRYTQGKMSYILNTITQATRALHLTAHCKCWTCKHVSHGHHVNKFWAYAGGLTNPCGQGAQNVWPVFADTSGPPLPRRRAHPEKKKGKMQTQMA